MTILAAATPNGTGAIAIVRLSGPRAYELAMMMIAPQIKAGKNLTKIITAHNPKSLKPRYAHLCKLYS